MADDTLTRLKKKRGNVRSCVTKHIKSIETELSKSETDVDILEEILEHLIENSNELKVLDEEIQNLIDPKDLENDLTTVADYKEKITRFKFKATKKLRQLTNIVKENVNSPDTSIVNQNNLPEKINIKLPKLSINKFYGEISQWLSFWNSFESAIHKNESLDKISKFNYLKAYLGGTALNSIEGFSITEDNYDSAIELLLDRFGRKEILINTHMSNILNISPFKNSNDIKAFRRVYDNIRTETRSLESLGVKPETYGNMLCPMLLKMMPSDLVLEFHKEFPNSYTIEDMIKFLSNQLIARERSFTSSSKDERPRDSFPHPRKQQFFGADKNEKRKSTAADLLTSENNEMKHTSCVFCDGDKNHKSSDCEFARSLTLEGRKAVLSKKGACFKCLIIGHLSRSCKVKVSCNICGKRHSSLMCYNGNKADNNIEPKSNALSNSSSNVYLQTLIVNINVDNSSHFVRAIIDTGSSRTYVSKYVVQALKLKSIGEETVMHGLFGGVVKSEKHKRYTVNLSKPDKSYSLNLEVMDQKKICSSIPKFTNRKSLEKLRCSGIFLSDICLNEKCLYEKEPDEINLLIGADCAGKLFTGEIKHISEGLLAMNTKLGWTIMGKSGTEEMTQSNYLLTLLNNNMDISEYWSLDTIGIRDPVEKKSRLDLEIAAKEHFLSTVSREPDGRYIVSLPWIKDHPPLSDCRDIAEKRLSNCVKSLQRSGKIEEYEKVFENWLEENIIEETPHVTKSTEEHFLPHRPVFKENSTTKIRPVFDGSARPKDSPSLNDCLEKGPNLIELIPSIINRFRFRKFGVTADIQKAFLQIALQKNDRPYLKFMWWEHGKREKLRIFQHKRVVFGISSSPFLLGVTLEHHLDNAPTHLQETAQKLKKSFYVDNCVLSLTDEDELGRFISESQALLSTAKFHLRGWEHTPTFLTSSTSPERIVPVLGLNWKPESDTLMLDLKGLSEELESPLTKRKILSTVHRIFDPIGFTCPITLKPKMLLQECWKQGISWDSELPQKMSEKFQRWWNELKSLKNLEIPRYLMKNFETTPILSFHVFCDASKSAYAASVFLRIEDELSVCCQLVQARSRVAPLKSMSIPRLELLSCTIAARLAHSTKLEMNLEDIPTTYWSDSINALYWIKGSENWATFVYNRVQEIRRLSDPNCWKHIAGQLNPADLPSRGCNPHELLRNSWWEGPDWLKQQPKDWPESQVLPDYDVINAEKRKSIVSAANMVENDSLEYTKRISSYKKIVRVTAWIHRFSFNSKQKTEDRKTGELSVAEITSAEEYIVKIVQEQNFGDEKNIKLRIFKDPNGLIRVSTRISMRKDMECFRYPVLLPSKNRIVHLLIFEKHLELGHAGVQTLISNLRENYWIIKSRKTIRQVVLSCVKCKKFSSKPLEVSSCPLPEDRIKDASVFEITGVDLFGPFYLKNGMKSWAVLFTCAIYRAIHLELVTSLSTEHFILALRRFISRRGRPSKIYSDNGTNLVGASNELKSVEWDKITEFATDKKILWIFNPPSAPWWGGFWERLIGLIKRLLRRILGNACLQQEEFCTILCDVESIINSRPLTYLSEEAEDLIALTPAMFMQDIKETGVPDLDQIDVKRLKRRFAYKLKLREDLRRRFRVEYLGQLKEFHKKNHSQLKEGDVVLIGDSNLKRQQWPLARILRLFPGKDGKIRVVELKTQSSVFLRPVQRLYPIEMSEQEEIPMQPGLPTSPDPASATSPDPTSATSPDPASDATSPDPDPDPTSERRSRYGRILRQRRLDC